MSVTIYSEEEIQCNDCGEWVQGYSCSCVGCELCGEYKQDIEERNDVKNAEFVCYDCYNELENMFCEECELLHKSIECRETTDFIYLCEDCFKKILSPTLSHATISLLSKLGGVA